MKHYAHGMFFLGVFRSSNQEGPYSYCRKLALTLLHTWCNSPSLTKGSTEHTPGQHSVWCNSSQ